MPKFHVGALVLAASVAIPLLMSPAVTQAAGKVDAKQWMIGANGSGYLYPKARVGGSMKRNYNLKGVFHRKFFHYEKQGRTRGINLGWTSNASAKTARNRSNWFFTRKSKAKGPIKFGELLAIGWERKGKKKPYIKYSKRKVGINLNWSSVPHYEWMIRGGKSGTPVRRGKDVVILYNLMVRQPLIRFDRKYGGDIGWPTSKRGGIRVSKYVKKAGGKVVKGVKWTGKELKKEIKRLTVVCKGQPSCIALIKLYQGYMIQLRAGAKMYRLPAEYRRLLAPLYPNLKNLNGYSFGYSRHQPSHNATTDCNKTYFNHKKYVSRLRKGELSGTADFTWLLHEIQHYDQCKQVGGRSRFALMWFGDLSKSVRRGGLKKIHDNMPMEQDAMKRAAAMCKRLRAC